MKKTFKSFDEILKYYIEENSKKEKGKHFHDAWYASGLGFCKRKQYFRRMGLEPTEPTEWRIRFLAEEGKAGHEWRERAAKEVGALIEAEGNLESKKYSYRGRFDLIVLINNKPVLVDIKTQRPEAFFYRKRLPKNKRVKDFQKMQLASYVLFAQKKYPNLKEARIHYADRGGGLREEYSFLFGKKMFDKVIKELKELNKYWEAKKFPPIKGVEPWQCKYCPYRSICKRVERENLNFDEVLKAYKKVETNYQKKLIN